MKPSLPKIAASLAFVLGALSVVAGGSAMRGWNPGYSVLGWLPVYNFIAGILTILIPAVLIWREHRFALPAAIGMFSLHTLVFLLLITLFRGVVATQSILAMLFRLVIWLAVLSLMFKARRANHRE